MITVIVVALAVLWLASGPAAWVLLSRKVRVEEAESVSLLDEIARRELATFFAAWDALVEGASS